MMAWMKGVAKLDILSLDGFACLGNELTFESKVLTYTVLPLIVAFMIFCPLIIARLRGYHDDDHDENHRHITVTDRFWTNLMFM